MSEPQSTIIRGATGVAGATFPLWNEAVALATGANQFLVGVLGLTVLFLTAKKLWNEVKIAEARRRDLDRKDVPK